MNVIVLCVLDMLQNVHDVRGCVCITGDGLLHGCVITWSEYGLLHGVLRGLLRYMDVYRYVAELHMQFAYTVRNNSFFVVILCSLLFNDKGSYPQKSIRGWKKEVFPLLEGKLFYNL